jgi:amino acid transporter
MAGEIKNVNKALPLALLGSIGLFMLYWGLGIYFTFEKLGSHFVSSIAYLDIQGVYPLGVEPMWWHLYAYAVPNETLVILDTICVAFSEFAITLGALFFATRNWFAWSFDRIIPPKLSAVDKRGNPWLIVITCFIVSMLIGIMDTFNPSFMGWELYTIALWGFGWIIVGLAAAVFPARKKEIFESSPGIVKRRVLGIPLVSIMGVLTMVVGGLVVYSTLIPAIAAPTATYAAYLQTVIMFIVLPVIIFSSSYVYWKRKGIPMDLQFKEIPPE